MKAIQSRQHPSGLVIFSNGEVFIPATKRRAEHRTFGNKGPYLSISYRSKKYDVHRLVAEAFVENPQNLRYVDHIDRNPHNNSADNLRWVSASSNRLNCDMCDNSFAKYGIRSTDDKIEWQRRYRATPEGRERIRKYNRKARLKGKGECA